MARGFDRGPFFIISIAIVGRLSCSSRQPSPVAPRRDLFLCQRQQPAQIVAFADGGDAPGVLFLVPAGDAGGEPHPHVGVQFDDVRRREIVRIGRRPVEDLDGRRGEKLSRKSKAASSSAGSCSLKMLCAASCHCSKAARPLPKSCSRMTAIPVLCSPQTTMMELCKRCSRN